VRSRTATEFAASSVCTRGRFRGRHPSDTADRATRPL